MQEHTQHTDMDRVITFAKQGRRFEALTLLRDILRHDREHVMAWKWLAYLSPDPQESLDAARYVQFLAPDDEWLKKVLPTLKRRVQPDSGPLIYEPPSEKPDSFRRPVWAAWILLAVLLCVGAATAGALLTGMLSSSDRPVEIDSLPRAEVMPVSTPEQEIVAQSTPRESSGAASVFVPSVSVDESTAYYDVVGDTIMDVQLALENEGPMLSSGERAVAVTSYSLWVAWEALSREDSCEMSNADVTLELTYTYPRWEPGTYVEHTLDEEWERFIAHVIDHEQHHGEIALACAYELASSIEMMSPPATCEDMESRVNALVDTIYSSCEEQQQAFDAQEGMTTFPLP